MEKSFPASFTEGNSWILSYAAWIYPTVKIYSEEIIFNSIFPLQLAVSNNLTGVPYKLSPTSHTPCWLKTPDNC
jgi:hypothetical protein